TEIYTLSLHDALPIFRRGCDVKQTVALAAVLGVQRVELVGQTLVASGVGEFGSVIADRIDERLPDLLVVARARNLAVEFLQSLRSEEHTSELQSRRDL